MLAAEVMNRDVVTLTPETPIVEAAALMLSKRVTSIPIVDASGALIGIVSERDLIHRAEIGTERRHAWWQTFSLDPDEHATEFLKVHGVEVGHLMTRDVVTVQEQSPLGQIVGLMDRYDINQVPVVHGDRVVGMVSRSDMLRLLVAAPRVAALEARSDDAIRKDLDALIAEAAWATVTSISATINHEVRQGVVSMSGVVGSEREREALLIAARAIPGVRAVDAELAVVPRDIAAI